MYNFYVDPSWRQEEIIPKYQQDIFAPANCLIRISYPIQPTFNIPLAQSANQRNLRQQGNFYVAYKIYVDLNLQASGEIILRQRENL